jgi:hypothetical protein
MDVERHVHLEVIARPITLCQSIRFQLRGLRHIHKRPHKEVKGRLRCRLVLHSQYHVLLVRIVLRLAWVFRHRAL